MRSATTTVASILLVLSAACFGGAGASPSATPGIPNQGPTHPPTTAEQWASLEQAALDRVEQRGVKEIGSAQRLMETGFFVAHPLELAPSTCYEAGLAWGFSGQAHVTVSYQPGADGLMPNDHLASTGGKLESGLGSVRFCSDHEGTANLTISSVGPSGAITNNELLEYALVIGSKEETPEESETRRADEAKRASIAGAQIEANIAAARERERQQMARTCRDCGDQYIKCRADRAAGTTGSGVTVRNSCELDFQLCPFGGSRFNFDRAENKTPCGEPS